MGLEPTTTCLEGRSSSQLSYVRIQSRGIVAREGIVSKFFLRILEKFLDLEESTDDHSAFSSTSSDDNHQYLSLSIIDEERRNKKYESESQCYIFTRKEPPRLVESKECYQDEVVTIGNSCEEEHEWEHEPELRQDILFMGHESQNGWTEK